MSEDRTESQAGEAGRTTDPTENSVPMEGPSNGGTEPVPGQPPGTAVPPVPAPGTVPGTGDSPGVHAAQGPSPDDGIHRGEKDEGSDASISSPGAMTSLAVPGKPDGEVDTRAR